VNRSEPCRRTTGVTGSSLARNSQNSAMPLVADRDRQPGHQERGLPGSRDELVVGEGGVLREDLPVGPEPYAGAGDALLDPCDLGQARPGREGAVGSRDGEAARHAPLERHRVRAGVTVDLDVEAAGQRVDHRRAHAVQSTRRDVGTPSELAAGMQPRVHDLHAGQAGLGLGVDGDAAPVVADEHRAVGVEHDRDPAARTRQRLVDTVVDHFPDAVHETPSVAGADVHAGALAYRLQALEHEQVPGVVRRIDRCRARYHRSPSPRGDGGWGPCSVASQTTFRDRQAGADHAVRPSMAPPSGATRKRFGVEYMRCRRGGPGLRHTVDMSARPKPRTLAAPGMSSRDVMLL
jgi:hypothetical protein